MAKPSNKDLKAIYDKAYENGEDAFFSRFSGGQDQSENAAVVLSALDWTGRTVLDIGCGSGHTAAQIAGAGARQVTGIDYSEAAIRQARETHAADTLSFRVMDFGDWEEAVDTVVSCGTLEHMDDPGKALRKMVELAGDGGTVLVTCPYFINIRGFVWMTLEKLFDVPMSLTDLHFISPFDIEEWLDGTDCQLQRTVPFDFDMANGEPMLADMKKRLTNALKDATMPNDRVDDLLRWLEKVIQKPEDFGISGLGGRNALYVIAGGAA